MKNFIKSYSGILFLILLFGALYSAILIVNHYNFRTSAEDLGFYNNAMYDYIHLQWHKGDLIKQTAENILADDFDLYLIILSPLSLLVGSYTLLIVQIIAILLGGFGIFKYILATGASRRLSLAASLQFYLFFGVFSSLLHEYNSFAVAAMIVPWFFYFLHKEKYKTCTILFLVMLISNENTSLYVSFICLGLIFNYLKDKKVVIYLIEYSLIAFAYYLIITEIAMPYFSKTGKPEQFEYSAVGGGFIESIGYIIAHPVLVFKMLLFNHMNVAGTDYVKISIHIYVLLSGGILLFLRPQYILMIIPVYFHKLLSDNSVLWGADGLYTIGFAPVIAIGVFSYLKDLWQSKQRIIIAFVTIILTMSVTTWFLFRNIYPENEKLHFFKISHYKKDYDVKKIKELLKKIPEESIVSAQKPFIPHLSLRDTIYVFPEVLNSDYVVLSSKENPDPLNEKFFQDHLTELLSSGRWRIYDQKDGFYIFERKHSLSPRSEPK